MIRLIIIIILLIPTLLFGQMPDSVVTNFQYESILKHKYDSVDNLLNKYYSEWVQNDSLGILKKSQRAWIKFRDENSVLISFLKGIPYSNSKQIMYQVFINMTEQRLSELKSVYWQSEYSRTFHTAGVATEKFFAKDIVKKIPVIKFSENQSQLIIKNINYIIHSDPSNRMCPSCGRFKVDLNLIPKSTLTYIYHVIDSVFLTSPASYGDRFIGTNEQNVNEKVEFDLTFEPVSLCSNLIDDIWVMQINVGQLGGGKRFSFPKIYFFDKDGSFVDSEISGLPGKTYKNNNELFIELFICDNYRCESGTIELCRYDRNSHKIIHIKTLGRREFE